ncbi:MAG: PAS domain S-box protein [Candidatus Neomarinimicrobiota bacterium]
MKTANADTNNRPEFEELNQKLSKTHNTIVRSQLAPILLGIAILYVCITFYYVLALTDRLQLIIGWIAASTTVILFILAYFLKRKTIPLRMVHSVALAIAILLMVDAIIYLALTGWASLTDLIMLLIIGCSFFLLSTKYVIIFIFLSLGGWLTVAWNNFNNPIWVRHGFSLAVASATAILIHTVRVRTIERAERLRLQNEYNQEKLEQTLADLKNQEYLYRDLFENANDLIQSVDSEGRFVYVNQRWKEVLGYNDNDLKDLRLKQIIAPDESEKCDKIVQSVLKGDTIHNLDTVFITKDGHQIFVEGNINGQFQQDRFIATRGIFRDVTIRRMALKEVEKMRDVLKDLNQQLSAAYEESRHQKDELLALLHDEQSAILLDSSGKILGVTEKAVRLTGFSRLGLIGKNIKDLVEPNSRMQMDNVLKVSMIGGFKNINTEFVKADGGIKKFCLGMNRVNLAKEKLFIAIICER